MPVQMGTSASTVKLIPEAEASAIKNKTASGLTLNPESSVEGNLSKVSETTTPSDQDNYGPNHRPQTNWYTPPASQEQQDSSKLDAESNFQEKTIGDTSGIPETYKSPTLESSTPQIENSSFQQTSSTAEESNMQSSTSVPVTLEDFKSKLDTNSLANESSSLNQLAQQSGMTETDSAIPRFADPKKWPLTNLGKLSVKKLKEMINNGEATETEIDEAIEYLGITQLEYRNETIQIDTNSKLSDKLAALRNYLQMNQSSVGSLSPRSIELPSGDQIVIAPTINALGQQGQQNRSSLDISENPNEAESMNEVESTNEAESMNEVESTNEAESTNKKGPNTYDFFGPKKDNYYADADEMMWNDYLGIIYRFYCLTDIEDFHLTSSNSTNLEGDVKRLLRYFGFTNPTEIDDDAIKHVFRLIELMLGLSANKYGQMTYGGKKPKNPKDFKIYRPDAIYAVQQMLDNIKEGKFILAYRPETENGKPLSHPHKNNIYPVCIPDSDLAHWMSLRTNTSSTNIAKQGKEEFDKVEKLAAINLEKNPEEYERLIAFAGSMSNTYPHADPELSEWANYYSGLINHVYTATINSYRRYSQEEDPELYDYQEKQRAYALNAAIQTGYQQDDQGHFTNVIDIQTNPAAYLTIRFASFVKSTALVFNPEIWIPATIEHIGGNFDNKVTNKLNYWFFHKKDTVPLPNEIREAAQDENYIKALHTAFESFNTGGSGPWLNNIYQGEGIQFGKLKKSENESFINYGLKQLQVLANRLSTGSIILSKSDALRFTERYWYNIQESGNNVMTREEFIQKLQEDPVGFIEDAATNPDGFEALIYMSNSAIGGANPLCEALYNFAAKHKITNALITIWGDKFWIYGPAVMQRLIPMSHTLSWLMFRVIGNNEHLQSMLIGSNYTLGRQFLENLKLDMWWLGSRTLGVFLVVAMAGMMGIEPPDDEDKINVYGEWKIGGVAIKDTWIVRDLLAPVSVPAMALLAGANGGSFSMMFWSGIETTCYDLPWFSLIDIFDTITNWDDNLLQAQEQMDESWDDAPDVDSIEYWSTMAGVELLKRVSRCFDPICFSSLYRAGGDYAYSNSMVYTRSTSDDPDSVERTTWEDAQYRKQAAKSSFSALVLDIWNGTWASNEGDQKTPYWKYSRPLTTISDPAQAFWYDYWNLDDTEDMSNEEAEEYTIGKVQELIRLMDEYESAEAIAAQGIVIPYDIRQAAWDYLDDYNNLLYWQMYGSGGTSDTIYDLYRAGAISSEEYRRQRDDARLQYDYERACVKELKQRLYDDTIPYTATKYYQENTTYNSYYIDADTGEPVGWLDYITRGVTGKNIEKNIYATGTAPTALITGPFTTVKQTGNYDEETGAGWYDEDLTDLDRLKEYYGDQVYDSGFLKGQNIYDTITAGIENNNDTILTGERTLVPVTEYSDKINTDSNREDKWTPFAELYAELENDSDSKSSSGYGSSYYSGYRNYAHYSGSGGGGSSKRSVYSHGSYSGINASHPTTSYSKSLNYTNYDYLYPKVYTKGSRWAYRRQDI